MAVFDGYSRYYDALYHDKDYKGETSFVIDLIKTHGGDAKSIFELGCGTGAHAEYLARAGYDVYGIDISDEMLSRANKRLASLYNKSATKIKFSKGDVRNVELGLTFDVVLSLFHVMSYQTSNVDVINTLISAKKHLKKDGVLIFDIWYGPAVLTDPPAVRVKRLSNEDIEIVRIAEPVMHATENIVDVNYQVFVKDKSSLNVDQLNETHRMRYFFNPEFDLFLKEVGMECIECRKWMSSDEPGFDTWYVYFVVRNIAE
ncbi:MAG: class I SAM-dependent methyltransferase [Gammaproteobacteria bacterium]|nr:class I SAM-dependent methyltransferase [Gammaproteobacteria bacterium]